MGSNQLAVVVVARWKTKVNLIPRILRLLLLLLAGGGLAGCLGAPPPWRYVLRQGDAEAITRWTLRQKGHVDLVNGESGILYRLEAARDDATAAKAIAGYLEVVHMLENLPPDATFLGDGRVGRDEEITYAFVSVGSAISITPSNQNLQRLFTLLRPDDRHPEFLKLWEVQRDHISTWYREPPSSATNP